MRFLTSFIAKNTRNPEIRNLPSRFKIFKLLQNNKTVTNKIYKALSVVYEDNSLNAIDRGLHFSRNWFKNKVPHHPAPHM